tara:strand:+ start:844 stop:1272 length:429 start_codon:yes stop_codon:yes gene_type:complete
MAYFLYNNDNLYRIFSNDSFKDNFTETFDHYNLVNVSDSDFNDYCDGKLNESYANGSVTFTPNTRATVTIENSESLEQCCKEYIADFHKLISDSDKKNDFNTFIDSVNNYDYSSLSYPLSFDNINEFFKSLGITPYIILQLY